MLSKQIQPAYSSARALSVLSSKAAVFVKPTRGHQLLQNRTILGLVPAVDKRLYRLARSVMPPISKTEQIALGCGTIGASRFFILNPMYECILW